MKAKAGAPQALRILGVMTGTSCDGLDAACIEVDSGSWQPLWSASAPYPKELRKRVLALQAPGSKDTIKSVLEIQRDLGDWYGAILSKMIAKNREKPDIIANHGQTVAHFPEPKRRGMTLQLGDPTRIAHTTGVTVISQFRDGDMAAGGQGAPLVPLFHRLLAHHIGPIQSGIAIHNIGGISNLTYIGPNERILAFDTGPGNIWIDGAAELATHGKQKFDRNGELATRGKPDLKAVEAVLKHSYFAKPAPKSTGRDDFPLSMLLSKTKARGADLVATATMITIESIARSYERLIMAKKLPLSAIFFCGGGAKNPAIVRGLNARMLRVKIMSLVDAGFDPQLIEAQAFAFFGFLTLLGQPLGGDWTGADSFGPPAHIVPGKNWLEVVHRVHQLVE